MYDRIERHPAERFGAERKELSVNRRKNLVWPLLILPGALFVILFMLVPLFSL